MSSEALKKYKREWNREWRLKNPEKAREQRERWAERSRIRRLERSLRPEVRKRLTANVAAWRIRNPQKTRAHRIVFNALRNGTLEKEPCFCGERLVQAHHDDYSKPLEVIWLCKPHHSGADQLRRAKIST